MKKLIQRILEECKINFSEQILQARTPTTVHYVLRNIKNLNKRLRILNINFKYY